MTARFACPQCALEYAALYFKQHSRCPRCRTQVVSDLKMVTCIEALIGLPYLWLLASFVNAVSAGMLLVPALVVHVVVVRLYVTPRSEDQA